MPRPKRVIALDVGDVRIGVALSDPTGVIAQPLEVYTRVGYAPDSRYVKALMDNYGCEAVIVGLPKNMDGSLGFQAQKARDFGTVLEKEGLTVYYQDERLTTVAAERALIQGDMRREERRRTVDKIAAAMILESWLNQG